MDGITAVHVVKILLYAKKQSHYTAVFFCFLAKFRQLATKKKPSATSRKELKKKNFHNISYISWKKKEKFARFRQ
jgi:hypothetical protein